MLTVLDLFSGIGGFSLGLERTGGFKTVAFCEIEPYCQAVLRKHWPDVPIYPDVTELSLADVGSPQVLCGGPPCQATSVAAAIHGKRTGATLWGFMRAVATVCSPAWIIVEQPPGNARWENTVSLDLESLGYSVSRLSAAASHIGAPHFRRRSFILAHRDSKRLQGAWRSAQSALSAQLRPSVARRDWCPSDARALRVADGIPAGLDRRKRIQALGNAVVPQVVEVIGNAILTTQHRQDVI